VSETALFRGLRHTTLQGAYAAPMPLFKPLVVLGVACVLALGPGAHAQTRHVDDPAGDGMKGKSLDITGMRISNNDRAIVATFQFVRVPRYGDFGFSLQEPGDTAHRALAVVGSDHSPQRDKNRFVSVPDRRKCSGLRVTWDRVADQVRLRIPSRCIRHGHYGDVRADLLAEIGSDADFAPKTPKGHQRWTRWISRG
jgi:hypothetical protein